MISTGLLFGMDTLISQAFGRKDYKLGDHILVQGLWISSAICMVTMPLIYALAHNYHLSGAKTDTWQAMLPYVHISFLVSLNNFLQYDAKILAGTGRCQALLSS